MYYVSWEEALEFCRRLSEETGMSFTLPTEAQWEYACRAGTITDFNTGKNYTTGTDSCTNMNEVGRYRYNGGQNYNQYCDTSAGTAKVGSYTPNAWGLYDMHGNVKEWCLDWFLGSITGNDPVGPPSQTYLGSESYRVVRGGDWTENAYGCTSSRKYGQTPSGGNLRGDGFRLVMSNQ